ncbi:MAG: peptide chain release factor N(5)-glutamine methyltransferase [candidate division Zixibacteria bacterium]|nr:peptide chain release factor N(5)-glutamine methyltransferase [candidate division Zixibacteria bacterium]
MCRCPDDLAASAQDGALTRSPKTIGEWRREISVRLRPISGDLASQEANQLVGEVAGGGPTELTLRHLEQLGADQAARLDDLVAQRLTGRPLAYVVGHVEFHGVDILCDERALIPRPETEELVELALRTLPSPSPGVHPLVIDVGTGSGNIALALAHQRPDLRLIATDVSATALALARTNCARLSLEDRVQFLEGRTLSLFRPGLEVDMIVSNPPYIAPGDPNLERSVNEHEPEIALFAGPAGTEIIAELIRDSLPILRPDGSLVCEIGYGQAGEIRQMVAEIPGWSPPEFHRDLAGIERILVLRPKS